MRTDFFNVLKNKEFSKIWLAQLISVVTANMLNFILLGRIYELTGSSIALGFLWLFYVLPTVILGPFSGVILDYFNKKSILFYSSFLQAVIALSFIFAVDRVWLLYTIILLYSFCDEFISPSIAVLVPSIVNKSQLAVANSLVLFTINGSIVLGFLAGGLMLKFLGFGRIIFLVVSLLLMVAATLATVFQWREPVKKKKFAVTINGFFNELIQGYTFIKNEPMVLLPMIFLTGLQVIIGMGLILLPAISKAILKIDFVDASYMILIPTVLGAVGGSLLVERIAGKYLKRTLVINGLYLLGVSLVITGLILPFLWPQAVFGGSLAVLMGGAYVLMYIPLQMLVQENTPFPVRGRVFGTLNTLVTVAALIPVFLATTLTDLFGVKLVLSFTGISLFFLALYLQHTGRIKLLLRDNK